jgi:hypothetical protein
MLCDVSSPIIPTLVPAIFGPAKIFIVSPMALPAMPKPATDKLVDFINFLRFNIFFMSSN